MSKVLATDGGPLPKFVQLSSGLTGYSINELWGTGMAESYYKNVREELGAKVTAQLLAYYDDIVQLFNDPKLALPARDIIRLWYLGQWHKSEPDKSNSGKALPVPAVVYSLEPNAYVQSLAWRAMGGHPQGARQQGYGSWSRPPIGEEEQQ